MLLPFWEDDCVGVQEDSSTERVYDPNSKWTLLPRRKEIRDGWERMWSECTKYRKNNVYLFTLEPNTSNFATTPLTPPNRCLPPSLTLRFKMRIVFTLFVLSSDWDLCQFKCPHQVLPFPWLPHTPVRTFPLLQVFDVKGK